MSALADGARRLLGRGGPDLDERVAALRTAAEKSRGRLSLEVVESAEDVVRRASERLAITADHTIVALAGSTGSGKSSTFNALTGLGIAEVGRRRPTTAETTGVSYGDADPSQVLEWLGVRRRHQVSGEECPAGLDGLVLLDLPDHDSTEVEHHLEVDRLVQVVDVMVWVLDPQKYADAALHERYLRPMASHASVMVVVLNHLDEVAPDQRASLLADLRRRLEEDDLGQVPVVATSATTGEGLPELLDLVRQRVRGKRAASQRLRADLAAAAGAVAAESGDADPGQLRRADRAELVDAFADAAGVPTVVDAVERSVVRRGGQHTGWPPTRWLARLKPDPLRRLHLDVGPEGKQLTGLGRASMPEPTRVQRARVDTAVRASAEQVGSQLTRPWSQAVRRASTTRLEDLNDALDRAVVASDLGVSRTPLLWRVARLVQLLLALSLVAGALWLLVLVVMGYLQLPEPETPARYGLPVPTLLLVVGAGGGLALAVVGRFVNGLVARSKARAARRRLRESIAHVVDELVLAPIDRELQAYREVTEALRVARR